MTGTPDFSAFTLIKTDKSLPYIVRASGVGILGALCAVREKIPTGAEIIETEVKRVQFLRGGFRVLSNVSRRTLRKYATDAAHFVTPLRLKVN